MKKILITLTILCCLGNVVFGRDIKPQRTPYAIGVSYKFSLYRSENTSIGNGFLINIKIPKLPLFLSASFEAETYSDRVYYIGVSFDYHPIRLNLTGILDFYFGPGILFYTDIYESEVSFITGLRAPVGFRIWVKPKFEIFLEGAPVAVLGFGTTVKPAAGMQGALGTRFWFGE